MDSLTQLALGAAVGYAVAGKTMGKKALLWGAVAGTIPDLDFIPTLPFDDAFVYLKYHRGFSHSLLFCLLVPGPLSWVFEKLKWVAGRVALSHVFFWGFFTHLILDSFTSWGTQVFWPHPYRVAFNSVFIIDPLYSIPLGIAVVGAIVCRDHFKREKWVKWGLVLSSVYLIWGLGVKLVLNDRFEALFSHHGIAVERFTTRPGPFNSILWTTTVKTEDGYYFGMISLLDNHFQGPLYFVPNNHDLIHPYLTDKTRELLSYMKGYYSVLPYEKGIMVRDLRYGMMGDPWVNGEQFVFAYYLWWDSEGELGLEVVNPRPRDPGLLLGQVWERLKGI